MANAITYIKNVGKSVGYASFDVIKEMNPVFSDFAETNGELATDMYKSIRNLKNKSKDIPNKIMESEYGKFGKTYLDNLFSDIKTGKLYNKERKAKYDSEAADAMMGMDGDFGFEDDFNFDDIDSFDDDEPSTNDMLDIVGEKTSNSINTTLARTAEYIVEGTTASNKAIYNQINNIYGGLHTGLATINQNISKMIEFHNEGTMTHYENSRTFFQESTRLDQERNQYLKEISESLKQLNGPTTNQKSTKTEYRKNTYSDMVTYEGVLDISRYGQNIKKNLKDKSGGVFDMLNMMIETGMLNTLAASPLEGLTKIMVSSVIPNAVEKSMENLNKSLSGMVGNALLGMKNKAKESSIWEGISEIFGINTNIQTKLDPSKYEKGKIPFDGITKKAIVEVIPTYLAKILSAVSGSKENRFDYENGKFVTIDQLRSEYDNLTKTSANKAAYGIDNVVRSKTRKLGWDENRQRQFDEDWEVIKEYMFRHQKNFNTRDKKLRGSSFGLKGELADENVRLLQKILDGNPEMLRYADQLFKEIDTHNRRMVDLQNSGSMTAIENGSIKEPKTPASGTSTYAFATSSNGTILSKLVAIHKELSYIRVYGSGRASGKKGKGGPKPSFDKFNIPEPRIGNYNQYDKDINKNASDHYDNLSDEELDERTARILATAENETIVDSDRKTFSERMHEASTFSAKMSVLVQSASELAKKPGEFVVAMMDKADARLYDIVYGPKEDKEGKKSFIGRLFKGLEGMFDKFSDFVTDTIIEPLKGKFTKENIHDAAKKFFGIFGIDLDKTVTDVKTYLFGKKDDEGNRTKNGLFGKFVDSFKSEMSGAFKWVKNAFKDVGDWAGITAKKKDKPNTVDTIINAVSDTTEAASGLKRVNKTGLAVISEGEMVLPPDMNPFNVSKRKRNEKNFKRDLISNIANADEYAEGKDEKGEKFNREDYERLPFWVRMSDTFMEGSTKFFEQLSQNIGLDKKDTDKFKDNAVDFIGKIKEYGGTMAAGATIGAGVSVLTGLIGGPLVGAAVGAGVGLIKKSETVQNMLFGEIDERTGERKGSKFISKDLANNISKYLPDMAKGATVGGILTALPIIPGGPVAGVILGSALGFAKNNEGMQNALFGEGKLLGTKENFQKKVQSVLPKMGVGALAGLLAGPFGLTTNLILGSALGFASDTNKFKDLMFGEEVNGVRDGGIFGAITKPAREFFSNMYNDFKEFVKTKMLQPVADAMAPLKKQFELMGESIMNHFKESFKMHIGAPIARLVEEKIINPIGKRLGGIFNFLMKPLKALIASPFQLIGAVGNKLRDKQVKSGNADYMTAKQRNLYRESRGGLRMWNDKYTEWDQSLENMDDESISAAKEALEGIRGSRNSVKKAAKASYDNIYKTLYGDKNIDLNVSKTALQILKNGDYEQAQEFIKNSNIPQESKTKALQVLIKESAKLKVSKQMKENADQTADQVAASLQKMGFKVDPAILKGLAKGDKEAEKLYKMIIGEEKGRKASGQKINPEQERHDEITNLLEEIRDILKKAKGETDPDDKRYEDDIQNYENRYNFVSGISDNPEDETAAEPESGSLISSYRIGKYNAKEYIKGKAGQARQFTSKLHKGIKGKLRDIRNSDIMNSIFGDKSVDWRNPIGPALTTVPMTDQTNETIKAMAGDIKAMVLKEGIDTSKVDLSGNPETYFNKIKSKFNRTKKSVTQFVNGHKVQYKVDKNGEYDIDTGDSETKEFFENEKEQQETQKGILTSLQVMPNTLGGIFSKLFNKDEEKETIFDKIWNFLTGDGGAGLTLASVLTSAIPIASLIGLLNGNNTIDNIASAVTGGAFGTAESNNTLTVKDENGNNVQIKTDKNGKPITDENDNYITVDGKTVSGDSYLHNNGSLATMPLSQRLIYNTARGTVMGTGSIVGSVFKANKLINNKTTQRVSKGISGALNTIKATATDDAVLRGVMDQVVDCIDKWTSAIRKVPMLKKYASNIDELGLKIGVLIEDNLPKSGQKLAKASATLSKVALVILIASIIVDFTTGFQDASTTLKINEEDVTLPHKIVCGLLRTIKNFIPIIGTFIPDSIITDLFINYVASWFGMDVSELKGKREKAKDELDTYNKEHLTNYSWAEYNKKIQGNYTWTEKIGNAFSSVKTNIKEKGLAGAAYSGIVRPIANTKVGKAVTSAAKTAGNWIGDKYNSAKDWTIDKYNSAKDWTIDKYNSAKDWTIDKYNSAKDWTIDKYNSAKDWASNTVDNVKTGIKTGIANLNEKLEPAKDIGSYALRVVKNIWQEIKTGKDVQATDLGVKNDPYEDQKKIVYNVLNLMAHPAVKMSKSVHAIWDHVFKPIGEGVVTIGKSLVSSTKKYFTDMWNGKLIESYTDSSQNADTGNKLVDGISSTVNGFIKSGLILPGLLTSAVGFVVRHFDDFTNGVKTVGSSLGNNVKTFFSNTWNGNFIKAYTDKSANANTGNGFIDGVSSVTNSIVKKVLFIPGLLSSAVGFVVRHFDDFTNGVKTVGSSLGNNVKTFFSNTWNGNFIKAYTDKSANANTGNGFIDTTSAVINGTVKNVLFIPGLLSSAVGFVVRNFDNFVDGAKTVGSSIGNTVSSIFSTATEGRNPAKDIFTTKRDANTGNALVDGISAMINKNIRITVAPIAFLTAGVSWMKNKATELFDKIAEAGELSSEDQTIINQANEGKVSPFTKKYWSTNTNLTGLAGGFNSFVTIMRKLFNLPTAIAAFINPLDIIRNATDRLADKFNIDDSETEMNSTNYGRGSGLYVGRGSAENKHIIQTVEQPRDEGLKYNNELSRNTFISQIDSRYRDQKFNISGDTEVQTLGDTGCAPAAAAMAINSSLGNNKATMEDSSRFALKYKVKNDGVNATYFNDEFARYGINAKYIASSNTKVRSNEIMKQLAENNRVVLMGEDHSNTTKANSPFGPNAHYVVANGLSEDGKFIYINDPESKVPNIKYPTNKVLTSSKLGIAANVARGSKLITNKLKEFVGSGTLPGSSVAEQCWNFLKSNGFTDEAAAGMLGNFMQESSMNPKECRNGRGPAGGLCQWETYGKYNTAWGEMANFAKSRGQDWTDLESQLLYLLQSMPKQFKWYTGQTGGTYNSKYADANGRHWYKNGEWAWWPEKMTVEQFKALKDVALATEIFERVYERASHPMMNKRIQFAQEFYNKFSGKYTPVTGTSSTSTITADTTTTTESTGSNSSDTVIDKIYGVFNGLAEAYGLKAPSSSSSDSTSSTKSNSSYGGYVSSNPEMAAKQVALVDKMYSVKGTLKYAQGNAKYPGSRNPEDGSGDCSSTVQWAYKKILGVDPGDWTGAQRTDSDTYTVATSTADESKLQLGDLLLKNGHVEMYAGDNQMIGHGGGATGKVLGPTVKTLDKTGKYNLVRRWVGFKGYNSVKASQANTSASGINVSGSASGNTVSDPALAQKQKSLVNLMYSYKGKLKYGQNNAQYPGTRNPDEGGADCSSMIQYAYKKVLGVDPGSWTQPQRTDPDTYTVATNVNDESKLQLGDMLLMPGHVEMYAGNSTIIGQNAGTIYGPNTQPLHKQFNLVRRWVGFRGKGSGLPLSSYNGRGTGGTDVHLEDKPFIDPMIKQTAPNSAQDNALRYINSGSKETFTSIIPPGITNNLNQKKASNMSFIKGKLKTVKVEKPPVNVVGKGSEIESIKTENNNLRVNVNNNNTSNNDLLLVVKSILQLMIQLVTNTDQLNNIAKLLGEYLTTVNSSDGSKESKQATLLAKQNLINAMQSGSNNNSNKPNAQLLALIEATEKIARE